MNDNTFKFKLIDATSFVKDGVTKIRLCVYCSFGFLVNIFTTTEKAKTIQDKASKNNSDISDMIRVFYNSQKNTFSYILKD